MESIKYSFLPSILTRQAEAEAAILAEFEAGNYTIEEPLVKCNPYLINPLAAVVLFARRWIRLPFDQQLQPAEIAKIAIILFIPVLICNLGKDIKSFKGIRQILAWGGVSAGCVLVLTENLSTAVIVMGITCIMIFVVHPKTKPFVALVGAGAVLLLAAVKVTRRCIPR